MSSPVTRIQHTRAGRPYRELEGHTERVSGIIHLPGGRRIMTCSYDGSLRVWNLESGAQIGDDWRDGEYAVVTIALSPHGKKVVSGSGDGTVRLWNINTGKVIAKWAGHAGSVKSLCWNRDGARIVSGSKDGTARVWDVESGEIILEPLRGGFDVDAVIYSPDETMIATGVLNLEKEHIKIWDTKTGKLITGLKEHRLTVTCLAWTADGRMLISGSLDNSIKTWNATTWQQIGNFEHTQASGVIAIAILSLNDRILASASPDDTVRLWNLENGQSIGPPIQPIGTPLHVNTILTSLNKSLQVHPMSCISFSTDGNLLATSYCVNLKNALQDHIYVVVRETGFNELLVNPNHSDKLLIDLGNAYRVPLYRKIHDSVHWRHFSRQWSPPPLSARLHHAPRLTFLDRVPSLSRQTHTKVSSLRPTLRSTPIQDDDDAPLCSVCSALDLRAILHDGVSEERALPLGHLTDITNKRDQCGLCRLVAFVTRRGKNLDKTPDPNISRITCALYTKSIGSVSAYQFKDLGIPAGVMPTQRDLCHGLCIKTSRSTVPVERWEFLDIQLLEEDAFKVGRTKELHGRKVGQTVDIGLVKRWIHICEHSHREECEIWWWREPGEVLPKSVRVVDVACMAIVPAPRPCRYVALSYLWGGTGEEYWTTQENLKQRSRRGGLDISVLPATIRDTMQLVHQLGERYLWIDALCIVQDDDKDKAEQIGAMDLIYGFSVVTIFAVGGTSVRDPLPGVRPGTRYPEQEIAKVQGLHLAVPLVHPTEAVLTSAWNTRGWTYQELMLSRRRIFFTSQQMQFECNMDVYSEDLVAEPNHFPWTSQPLRDHSLSIFMPSSALPQRHLIPSAPPQRQTLSALEHGMHQSNLIRSAEGYLAMVERYTLRRLTFESDIVNAITALINAITKAYQWAGGDPGKAFRFGMPIGDLERALLWQPTANTSREQRAPPGSHGTPWPSWSWAAWRGAVRYEGGTELVLKAKDSFPDIQSSLVEQWHVVGNDSKLVHQDVWRTPRFGSIDHWAIYVPPKGDIDARQLIGKNSLLQPGTLVFRTSSAHFDVAKVDDLFGADAKANYTIYSILSDIPQPSTRVGRVILPCSTPSRASFEFVVLSRTSGRPGLFDEDRLDEHGIMKRLGYSGCMFYVMAVRKMRNEDRMERVGVGIMFDRAWVNSTTEQKIVFLG